MTQGSTDGASTSIVAQHVAWKLSGGKAPRYATAFIVCPGPGLFDAREKIASKVDIAPDPKGSDSTRGD